MKTIKIKIDGFRIEVEASGFPDASCLDALKEIESAVGKASEVKLKAEAHQKVKADGKTTTA